MTARQFVGIGITIGFVTLATVLAWASVNTDGLALHSASRADMETKYTFTGKFTYSYAENGRTFVTNYEATVSATWNPAKGTASENISYQRVKFEGGQVSAHFSCSADPFVAFQGAWPTCKPAGLQIDAHGSQEGADNWNEMLKDKPLTFRRADPAAAQALINKAASTPKNSPPPPPTPSPTPIPGGEAGRGLPTQFSNPSWRGRRVDLCLHWGADCGQPAADEFCKRSGFTRSTAWKPAERVGETLVLGDNKPCSDPRCDGFATISCVK
jgi:hypothetical protein